MLAYNFMPAFTPQIATDARDPKILTLRRARKPPSRHANVGEPIGLWTGQRRPGAARHGVGLVILTALLRFDAQGIRYVSDVRSADDELAREVQQELLDADSDSFARRDGFENYAAMWAWHSARRDKTERPADSLVRHVICWRPLNSQQIAAVENGAQLEVA